MEHNQVDFLNYHMMFKKNYRRGIDRLKAILQSPSQAMEFVNNLGGVSVLFNVPVDAPDPNSDKLLLLIQSSSYAENAVQTWMRDFFSFETWDALLSNKTNAEKIASNPVLIRALISSPESSDALAASNIAMTAVAASNIAMTAVINNTDALNKVVASNIAMTAVAASNIAMTAVAASALALNRILKQPSKTPFADSPYLNGNFDRLYNTIKNTTYFKSSSRNGDAHVGNYYLNSDGNIVTMTCDLSCIFFMRMFGSHESPKGCTMTIHAGSGNKYICSNARYTVENTGKWVLIGSVLSSQSNLDAGMSYGMHMDIEGVRAI